MPSPPMPVTILTAHGPRIRVGSHVPNQHIAISISRNAVTRNLVYLTTHEAAALLDALASELSIVERSQQSAKDCNNVQAHLNRPLRPANRNAKATQAPTAKKRKG